MLVVLFGQIIVRYYCYYHYYYLKGYIWNLWGGVASVLSMTHFLHISRSTVSWMTRYHASSQYKPIHQIQDV